MPSDRSPRPLTRLRLHDIVSHQGRYFRVALVNECRALIVPVDKRLRQFVPQTGDLAGKPVAFTETETGQSISPDSDLDTIGRWDPIANRARLFGETRTASPPTSSTPEPIALEPIAPEPIVLEQQSLL